MSDVSLRNSSDLLTDCSPLSQACIKALTDRLDDKRKYAANEIEKMTVDFSMSANLTMINRLIIVLGHKFCLSPNQNTRKGGLIGLAAVMVGFKNGSTQGPPPEMVEEVIRPILTCLLDSDARVRYYACESLYNVTKVAGSNVLALFESIFDTLTRLVADPDLSVRAGSETLNRLLKDIVVESKKDQLNVEEFVTKLEEYVYTKNPFTRMFLLSWIRLLDTKIDMMSYLPNFLDGILNYLYDKTDEICASTLVLLSEFLNRSSAFDEAKIEPSTQATSSQLPKSIARSKKVAINTQESSTINSPQHQQQHQQQPQTNFQKFIQALYKTFHDNDSAFEDRGKFIIVNLCSMTKPETVYLTFATIISEEKNDPKFAYNLVQKLNQILLTAPALNKLRSRLSNSFLDGDNADMVQLFNSLMAAWSRSPIASITLCLLTGDYKQAKESVMSISNAEITIEILVQIDWVVQLIESPIFVSLRLRLLDQTGGDDSLIQTLYGLLMILPQSDAYRKLSHRLDQVHKFRNSQHRSVSL